VGSARQIGGVVTQGRTQYSQYVTSYKVEVSSDGSTWADVDGGATFTANSAANDEKVENMFSSPVSGRYVRIVVQSWNSHISLRAGVLFCEDGPWTNLAHGRPTTQISTVWASSGAVDGVATTCSHTCHLGTLDAYPWWRVQLAGSYPIGTVRVSMRPDHSNDFLNILVEDMNGDTTLCGSENVTVPLGQALDVVCSVPDASPPQGSAVKVVQQSTGMYLALCEVEVYGPDDNGASFCYDGVKYASEACVTCSGRGPSQCITCAVEHAFVPVRGSDSSAFEGYCQQFEPTMKILVIPGPVTPVSSLMPTYLSKWGTTGDTTARRATLGPSTVQIQLACYVQKNEYCAGRSSSSDPVECTVTKLARLKSVERIAFSSHDNILAKSVQMHTDGKCNSTSQRQWTTASMASCYHFNACCDPPNDAIGELVDLGAESLSSLCDGIVKLL